MPVTRRISDSELRERLEEHGYNVPPILCDHDDYPCVTDTTRAILAKNLSQLDKASKSVFSRSFGAGLDYSSSEDEEPPTPIKSSSRAGRLHQEETRRPMSITTQASPKNSPNHSSYFRKTELVSFLIICLPVVFFLVVSLQYLSLAPASSVIAAREVRACQLNELVQPRLTVPSQNITQKLSSHISFMDTLGEEGTVYVKTASLEDGSRVFRGLYGRVNYLRLAIMRGAWSVSSVTHRPMKPDRK